MTSLFKFTVRVVAADGPSVFQTGTVFARRTNMRAAEQAASRHVNATWPTTDPRVDYRIELSDSQKLTKAGPSEKQYNRPDQVWTAAA